MQSWNGAEKLGVCVLFWERFTERTIGQLDNNFTVQCLFGRDLMLYWFTVHKAIALLWCNARPLLLVQFIAGGWVCVCRKRERREKATNLITMRCTSLSIQFTDWLKPAKILFAAHCLDLFGGGKDLWDGLYQNENGQIWFAWRDKDLGRKMVLVQFVPTGTTVAATILFSGFKRKWRLNIFIHCKKVLIGCRW